MQTAVEPVPARSITSHATFLASVSRHFISLEIDSMLEAVGHAAVRVLGDVCAVDRIAEGGATRILEVRTSSAARLEPPRELAGLTRGEVGVVGPPARLSVPNGGGAHRFGTHTISPQDGKPY
jgi:hypothetical protein